MTELSHRTRPPARLPAWPPLARRRCAGLLAAAAATTTPSRSSTATCRSPTSSASTAMTHEPDRRHAERARRRPDAAREVVAQRARAQHHRALSRRATATRPTPRSRTTARRSSSRCAARPATPPTDRRRAGLHRPLEHLGIRHDRPAAWPAARFRRITASTTDDDVDPAYLPAGRGFVFASNRQTKTKTVTRAAATYYALDEYERERVLNLHTMDADGGAIKQISFNQSHDRNPVVRPNGDIMFSRWEHVGHAQPLRGLPRQARRHRHVRALRRAQPRQQLPAPARHGPGRASTRASCRVVADVAVGHAGRRRADVHRRGQLLRAEHAGQHSGAGRGRPGRGHRQGAEPRPRPVAVRPHHHALPAVGRHRPRAGRLPPLRGHAQRRRRSRAPR